MAKVVTAIKNTETGKIATVLNDCLIPIKAFETDDGDVFETAEAAARHETEIRVRDALRAEFKQQDFCTNEADKTFSHDIIGQLIDDYGFGVMVFEQLRKLYGKTP